MFFRQKRRRVLSASFFEPVQAKGTAAAFDKTLSKWVKEVPGNKFIKFHSRCQSIPFSCFYLCSPHFVLLYVLFFPLLFIKLISC